MWWFNTTLQAQAKPQKSQLESYSQVKTMYLFQIFPQGAGAMSTCRILPHTTCPWKGPSPAKTPNQDQHWYSVSMCPNCRFLLSDCTPQWAKREHQVNLMGRAVATAAWGRAQKFCPRLRSYPKSGDGAEKARRMVYDFHSAKHKHLTHTLCRNFCLSGTYHSSKIHKWMLPIGFESCRN